VGGRRSAMLGRSPPLNASNNQVVKRDLNRVQQLDIVFRADGRSSGQLDWL
jgi:hypothetical protein